MAHRVVRSILCLNIVDLHAHANGLQTLSKAHESRSTHSSPQKVPTSRCALVSDVPCEGSGREVGGNVVPGVPPTPFSELKARLGDMQSAVFSMEARCAC